MVEIGQVQVALSLDHLVVQRLGAVVLQGLSSRVELIVFLFDELSLQVDLVPDRRVIVVPLVHRLRVRLSQGGPALGTVAVHGAHRSLIRRLGRGSVQDSAAAGTDSVAEAHKAGLVLEVVEAGFAVEVGLQVIVLDDLARQVAHRVVIVVELLVLEFGRVLRQHVQCLLNL